MSGTKSRFAIDVTDEITLSRDDTIAHVEHGPMHVEQITISATGTKRARLGAELREDRMSIELTDEEIRDRWGEVLALDPFALDDGRARYSKSFASSDDEIEVTVKVSGPEADAQPVMAHLDDQANRVLEAIETEQPPEECQGRYNIDWPAIFGTGDGDA